MGEAQAELEKLKQMSLSADKKALEEIEKQKQRLQDKLNAEARDFKENNSRLAEIENKFKKAEAEHDHILHAEEARRKDKLRLRREQMKAKRLAMKLKKEEAKRKEKEILEAQEALKKTKDRKEKAMLKKKAANLKKEVKDSKKLIANDAAQLQNLE